jgi:hypothetical protein
LPQHVCHTRNQLSAGSSPDSHIRETALKEHPIQPEGQQKTVDAPGIKQREVPALQLFQPADILLTRKRKRKVVFVLFLQVEKKVISSDGTAATAPDNFVIRPHLTSPEGKTARERI